MKHITAAISILLLGGTLVIASAADLRVAVKQTRRGPLLSVNGEATAPTLFFVNVGADPKYWDLRLEEIATAARHGVSIVSMDTYMPWQQDGVPTSFAVPDSHIDAILKASPNALILPRFGVTWPPPWWMEKHRDEIMLYDDGKRQTASVHSHIWRAAAAENVTALVKHLEEKYGDHILGYHPSGQHTGEWFYDRAWEGRLSGFEPPARDQFRAFLKTRYRSDDALRKAWRVPDAAFDTVEVPTFAERTHCKGGSFRDPLAEQKTIDYFEFENLDMAMAVEDICKAVKAAAPHKIAVMFYGYSFELASLPYGPQAGGHLAMWYLLKSPYLDMMCSPVSYQNRAPGGGGFFMTTVDSVQAHGKLWLVEDDTRTHFAENDAGYGRCTDFRETSGVLARNFGSYVTRGAAVWWMDLPGTGWYQGDELWSFLGKLQSAYQNTIGRIEPYDAEIAVILDERSCLYMGPSRQFSALLMGTFREHWYRIGAPVGIYLLNDLVAGKVPPAKMYVMLNAFCLDRAQIEGIRRNACRKGRTVVWMYAPGIVRDGVLAPDDVQDTAGILLSQAGIAGGDIVFEGTGSPFSAGHGKLDPMFEVTDKDAVPMARYAGGGVAIAAKTVGGCRSVYCGILQLPSSLLRDLAREAGVHIYSHHNDVITAGNGIIGIHASSEGRKTIRMPSECELVDAITGARLGKGQSFQFDMKLGDTKLVRVLRWGQGTHQVSDRARRHPRLPSE